MGSCSTCCHAQSPAQNAASPRIWSCFHLRNAGETYLMSRTSAWQNTNCAKHPKACTGVGEFLWQLLPARGNRSFDVMGFSLCFHFLALGQWIGTWLCLAKYREGAESPPRVHFQSKIHYMVHLNIFRGWLTLGRQSWCSPSPCSFLISLLLKLLGFWCSVDSANWPPAGQSGEQHNNHHE